MRDVDALRARAEEAREAGGDRRLVVITPELADTLCDLADAARRHLADQEPGCRCEHDMAAALARLDGGGGR